MERFRWLVTGATGQVGSHVVQQLLQDPSVDQIITVSSKPLPTEAQSPSSSGEGRLRHVVMDLAAPPSDWQDHLVSILHGERVDFVIHCAAMCNVQQAFLNQAAATAVNTTATLAIGQACAAAEGGGASVRRLVYCSTDMVFGAGDHGDDALYVYSESDEPKPLSHYGRSKLAGEDVIKEFERAVVARLPLMYGAPAVRNLGDVKTTFVSQLRSMMLLQRCQGFEDEFRTPLSLCDAAKCLINLARTNVPLDNDYLTGTRRRVFHIAGPERMSRYDMLACMRTALVQFSRHEELGQLVRLVKFVLGKTTSSGSSEAPQKEEGEEEFSAAAAAASRLRDGIESLQVERVSRNSFPASEPRALNLSMSADAYRSHVQSDGCGGKMLDTLLAQFRDWVADLAKSSSVA